MTWDDLQRKRIVDALKMWAGFGMVVFVVWLSTEGWKLFL